MSIFKITNSKIKIQTIFIPIFIKNKVLYSNLFKKFISIKFVKIKVKIKTEFLMNILFFVAPHII